MANPPPLNQAQRRAIGHGVSGMRSLLRELKTEGFKSHSIAELDEALYRFGRETNAEPPRAAKNTIAVALAQLLTLAYELRPSTLEEYGPLADEARAYLDREAGRLIQLTSALADPPST